MSQLGTNLAFDKVAAVLQTTFGQQSTTKDKTRPTQVHYQDESWYNAEEYYGEEEWDDAYCGAEENYYDDDGDTWYEDAYYGEEEYEQNEWYEPSAGESSDAVAEYDDVYRNYKHGTDEQVVPCARILPERC